VTLFDDDDELEAREPPESSESLFRHGLRGSLRKVAIEAGRHGVVTRSAWTDGRVLHLCEAQQLKDAFRLVALEVARDSFGNYNPTDEDLRAIDWRVISKSRYKFPK